MRHLLILPVTLVTIFGGWSFAQTSPSSHPNVLQVYESVAENHPTKPKKLSWWQRTKAFFNFLIHRYLGSDDETLAIIIGLILALVGLTPFAIMAAGLILKKNDWAIHFIINLLIIILAIVLFVVTCGIGYWGTVALLIGALIHAIWYVLSRR
ncbi:MAG: hypothetical protein NZ580_03120 [Bacteroidia bacterium]|nr:hypothetical protein [Bacteroidia bacterium]MDW8235323.1 hypothetical protein [Bacteroidia bacterium]